MDLSTANKQMTEILEMFKNATSDEFIMFDLQFAEIVKKAVILSKIYHLKGN